MIGMNARTHSLTAHADYVIGRVFCFARIEVYNA